MTASEAIQKACALIELGDARLLAADGPCGNQPPDLTLKEWRTLYRTLVKAKALCKALEEDRALVDHLEQQGQAWAARAVDQRATPAEARRAGSGGVCWSVYGPTRDGGVELHFGDTLRNAGDKAQLFERTTTPRRTPR